MQLEIRLKNILREYGLDRHGVTGRIARDLDVHRHTIGKLYRNQLANPSLKVLGMLCAWLESHGVPAEILPQALLGSRASGLWEAVARPGTVRIYLGEYQQIEPTAPEMLWVSRRDSTVAGEIVQVLSTPTVVGEGRPKVLIEHVPFRFATLGSHVRKAQFEQDLARSREMFTEMRSRRESGASILVGSQRVNYMVEHLVGDLFGCEPFRPLTDQIRVPFYLVYRRMDRPVPSCFGGQRNPPRRKSTRQPGIYYLTADAEWTHCPWISKQEDAGIVITVYDPGTKAVEMAVFGFSGRGTEALGRQLLRDADPFWPPYVESKGTPPTTSRRAHR